MSDDEPMNDGEEYDLDGDSDQSEGNVGIENRYNGRLPVIPCTLSRRLPNIPVSRTLIDSDANICWTTIAVCMLHVTWHKHDSANLSRLPCSKTLVDSDAKAALEGFEKVLEMQGDEKGEWGFKALKQIVKLHFRFKRFDKMIERYITTLHNTLQHCTPRCNSTLGSERCGTITEW
jgi:hypothetical protein